MDQNDYLIKQRLIQKIEYTAKDFDNLDSPVDESALRHFYEVNAHNYATAPAITFAHVFFDAGKRGDDKAFSLAEEKIDELNALKVPFQDAPKHGDRFLYHVNYVEHAPEYVTSHFGEEMAAAVFSAYAGDVCRAVPVDIRRTHRTSNSSPPKAHPCFRRNPRKS